MVKNNRGRGRPWGLEENRQNKLSREGHRKSSEGVQSKGERQSWQGFGERLKDTLRESLCMYEGPRARDTEEGGTLRRKTDQGSENTEKGVGSGTHERWQGPGKTWTSDSIHIAVPGSVHKGCGNFQRNQMDWRFPRRVF